MRLSVCFSSLLLGLALVGLAPAQITYDAVTDREIRPKPPRPALGPAGVTLKDPTFGSLLLRVTDAHTVPDKPNAAYFTPAGSFVQAWAPDSRRFFVRGDAGHLVFDFDPQPIHAKMLRPLPLDGPAFSGVTNDVVYGLSGKRVVAYSIVSGKSSVVLDLNRVVPDYPEYQYAVSVSADDTKFAVSFSGMQDTFRYLVWFDRSTGTQHLLDLKTSTLDGRPTPIQVPAGAGIHSQDMDRSGRYVSFCGPRIPGQNACFWDTQAGTFTPQTNKWSGHAVLGYGCQVNQSGILVPRSSDGRGFILRPLATPNENLRQLINPPPSPPYAWSYGGHWSWASARPDVLNPVVGTFYRDPDKRAWGLWDDEVVAVRTEAGASTVWRFAHHRTVFDGKNFWDCPRGNLSPDGRWFIFTSNWEKTLGTTPNGQARQDVFLVALKVASK
ncbi:MAG: hypothetical protein HZA90_27435 [Verrucomicrobia bacterium]|nr:hypothetical protein [Verrucomicrobiota bacterium]